MAQIFLSYASDDRARVKPLAEALQQRGFTVWWDRSLAAGDDFSSVIQRELQAAKAVIVVWTQTSVASVWVRDEAGRARDDGRLVPVMLDAVEIPLGFGTIQAEDFSRWNGAASAAQMQLLEESLRAKIEGRGVDGAAVARKRQRLMNRIRVVSVLSVVAAIVGIAAGVNNIVNPQRPQIVDDGKRQDNLAELLRLVRDGTITPEQAIELSRLLEDQTFATASLSTEPPLGGAGGESEPMRSEDAPAMGAPGDSVGDQPVGGVPGETAVATVSSAEFEAAARETYRESLQELLTHPDATVRTAAINLSNPAERDSAMRTLWAYAEANPGATQAAIYRVCGAVGEANNNPLGLQALERARAINPQDTDVWRMLSFGLRRDNRVREAAGAALVSQGLEAQAQGNQEAAEERLQQALPNLQTTPDASAFVEGQLGDAAARRNDWNTAAVRYDNAFRLRERTQAQTNAEAPPPVQAQIEVDAQKLVRALDRSGRTEEACQAVERAHEAGVEETDANVTQRCERARLIRPRTNLQLRQNTTIQRSTNVQQQQTTQPVQRSN